MRRARTTGAVSNSALAERNRMRADGVQSAAPHIGHLGNSRTTETA
jgi:hypothetical protein